MSGEALEALSANVGHQGAQDGTLEALGAHLGGLWAPFWGSLGSSLGVLAPFWALLASKNEPKWSQEGTLEAGR